MALLQVLLMGLEDPHSFEERLNILEDRLAALETSSRVSSFSSSRTSNPDAAGVHGAAPPRLAPWCPRRSCG